MKRFQPLLSLLSLAVALLASSSALAASFQKGDYGGKLTMTYYIPEGMAEKAPLVLSLHYCGGTEVSGQSWFQSFADKTKFMIISPKSPGDCWDASPGRSGDRAELAKMIDWAIKEHGVDATRVYSAGASSGACMSETMLASYPDKIAAAAVLAGVPVGFWGTGNTCSVCSMQVAATQTPMAWGDKVRAAGPMSYMGSRGRIQLFHAIKDQYLGSGNLAVEVSQWSDALGVTGSGTEEKDKPRSGWTRTSYKDAAGNIVLQSNWWGNSPQNSHDLTSNITPALWNEVVAFFQLDQAVVAPVGSSSVPSATGSVSAPPVTSSSAVAPHASTTASSSPAAATSAVTTPTSAPLPTSGTPTATAPTTSATGAKPAPGATSTNAPTASAKPSAAPSVAPVVAASSSASSNNAAPQSDPGCGCQVPGSRAPGGTAAFGAMLAALGVAFARRRRAA